MTYCLAIRHFSTLWCHIYLIMRCDKSYMECASIFVINSVGPLYLKCATALFADILHLYYKLLDIEKLQHILTKELGSGKIWYYEKLHAKSWVTWTGHDVPDMYCSGDESVNILFSHFYIWITPLVTILCRIRNFPFIIYVCYTEHYSM